MSVPFSFPSVLVRGDLTTRILPGGRERVRSILSAHPAVRAIASDEHLDVAILKRGLTADAYELAAEVRRAVPRDIDANELCGVCVRAHATSRHGHGGEQGDQRKQARGGEAKGRRAFETLNVGAHGPVLETRVVRDGALR